MSLPPRQLGAYRAVPASRVRMAVTRNSVITSLRGLAPPAPPPVDETKGGELTVSRESDEVTGELAISRESDKVIGELAVSREGGELTSELAASREGCELAVREGGEVTGELAASRKGGEVTGKLAISREENYALLVDKLKIEITEERKKRGKAEHEYIEIKKRLAEEKTRSFKMLAEEKSRNLSLYDKVLQNTAFYKGDIKKREMRYSHQLTLAKGEIEMLKQQILSKAQVEQFKEAKVEEFEEDEIFRTPGLLSPHLKSALAFQVPYNKLYNIVDTEGMMASIQMSAPLTRAPSASSTAASLTRAPSAPSTAASWTRAPSGPSTTAPLTPAPSAPSTAAPPTRAPSASSTAASLTRAPSAPSTAASRTRAPSTPSTSAPLTPASSTAAPMTRAPLAPSTAALPFTFKKRLGFDISPAKEENIGEIYKDTPDHIKVVKNLPKRGEEVFAHVENRLSAPTNYKFLALLYNSTNGEETVEAFQLTRDTFREKYGEEFEAAEKVAAAGPTGGRGQDKARDAVMSTRSDTWVRGITWMFNSLTDFVQDKPEFRYYNPLFVSPFICSILFLLLGLLFLLQLYIYLRGMPLSN